jgi:hypothetical protein
VTKHSLRPLVPACRDGVRHNGDQTPVRRADCQGNQLGVSCDTAVRLTAQSGVAKQLQTDWLSNQSSSAVSPFPGGFPPSPGPRSTPNNTGVALRSPNNGYSPRRARSSRRTTPRAASGRGARAAHTHTEDAKRAPCVHYPHKLPLPGARQAFKTRSLRTICSQRAQSNTLNRRTRCCDYSAERSAANATPRAYVQSLPRFPRGRTPSATDAGDQPSTRARDPVVLLWRPSSSAHRWVRVRRPCRPVCLTPAEHGTEASRQAGTTGRSRTSSRRVPVPVFRFSLDIEQIPCRSRAKSADCSLGGGTYL